MIGIDDFAKVELRVAEIVACEPVKRAKKLLKLTLNDGQGQRSWLPASRNIILLTSWWAGTLFW